MLDSIFPLLIFRVLLHHWDSSVQRGMPVLGWALKRKWGNNLFQLEEMGCAFAGETCEEEGRSVCCGWTAKRNRWRRSGISWQSWVWTKIVPCWNLLNDATYCIFLFPQRLTEELLCCCSSDLILLLQSSSSTSSNAKQWPWPSGSLCPLCNKHLDI